MRNIPPAPPITLNGQVAPDAKHGPASIAGFARGTPHDGYFFDHPDEVISGGIPLPRFNLENLAALERHVNSLVLEQAALDYASNLEVFLTDRGELIENNASELVKRLAQAAPEAKKRASQIF